MTVNVAPALSMSCSVSDLSVFGDLLNRLEGIETLSVREDPRRLHPVGSLIDHKGSVRKVTKIYDVNADDWLSESDWRMVVVKPWAKSPPHLSPKIQWLEDESMPRIASR